MEETIIFVKKDDLLEVNKALQNGWKVKMIIPFCQPKQANSSSSNYGAYVVLERKEL